MGRSAAMSASWPTLDIDLLRAQAFFAEKELERAASVPVPASPEASPAAGAAAAAADQVGGRSRASSGSDDGAAVEKRIQGWWCSDMGECLIAEDRMTSRLYYEEPMRDGDRLHGWLLKQEVDGQVLFEAALVHLEENEDPWYGPSFGEEPESVGDIRVRHVPISGGWGLQTQIRVEGEDEDWGEPTVFRRRPQAISISTSAGGEGGADERFVFGGAGA
eukprot:TRINITY_DN10410_c2_g1_i1.p1 TRINITY_DN10410_c2_g1~~TRINITY_DN10410_c2_g1_i1.p1  ORF type:complete len:219 (+),score=57.09 TRINITY_DN10410_c2_g1_i1:141-797(+)